MDILEKIKEITAEQLDIDESLVTMDASFINDLEADSLDLVQLMMAFEEEFDMEISDEEAEEKTTDIYQEDRDLLLEVYEELTDGSMQLPLENDEYVIRELVDVSFTTECDEAHDHKEELAEEGTTIEITFDLGVDPDEEVIVMAYIDGQWVPVECENNGDGTVTCVFEDICPVVFCVKNTTPPAQTGDEAGRQLILWIVLMAVSFAAIVILVVGRRKFVR